MTTWNVEMDTKIIHLGLLTSKEKTLKKCDMSLNVKKVSGCFSIMKNLMVFRDLQYKICLSSTFWTFSWSMVASGFRSSGHLSFIHQFAKKWHRLASTASNKKKMVNFNMIFHESTKSIFFQNIKIKLNLRTWMTLKSSVVIFQALEPLHPQCKW